MAAPPRATVAAPRRPEPVAIPERGEVRDALPLQAIEPPVRSDNYAGPGEERSGPYTAYPESSSPSPAYITGPSFLGLSSPGPASSGAHHAAHSSSGNVDYLLEDEDEPGSGKGKFILIAVALALAVGFGYLRFRQGGFDWLTSNSKKLTPSADAAPSDAAQNVPQNAPQAPNQQNDVLKTDATNGAAAPPATSGNSASGVPENAAASHSSTPPGGAAAETSTTPSPAQTTSGGSSSTGASPSSAMPESASNALPKAAEGPADSDSDTPVQAPAPPKTRVRESARKPSPARSAVAPVERNDSVAEAERYIYGRGAAQDCDQGVRLLKTNAQQSNAKAMISLGALYSTGTCTPRDLPTAYRYFALALHKQPDNQLLQDDLKSLWDKMTPPERQLAIKLSQ